MFGFSGLWGPELCIYMPLKEGSLDALVKKKRTQNDQFYDQVMSQMLNALDFLASRKFCHRDVKPENILYTTTSAKNETYTFQLADFGLGQLQDKAITCCGTLVYMAPEYFKSRHGKVDQCPKVDIWSLFFTLARIHKKLVWPPRGDCYDYSTQILPPALAVAKQLPRFEIMAREDPKYRASAAQCLVLLYNGENLTT